MPSLPPSTGSTGPAGPADEGTFDGRAVGEADRPFDGVICFGGVDWWYHNRGHYDLQMMRELSRRVPVLYVNSIGMRLPTPGRTSHPLRRIRRKLASLRRGLVPVRERFWVQSPAALPAGMGAGVNRRALAWQVRRAAGKMGIARPLLWVAIPSAQPVVESLGPVGVVYQRTDRFEAFAGVDPARIGRFDRLLKARADLTLYCSSWLLEQERDQPRRCAFVDHGVDADRFEAAGRSQADRPADAAALGRPLVGFVGGIDAHTFDPPLLVEVARRLPQVRFMLVGGCSLPEGWCTLPNVHLLGQRPYEQVASYMAAADVLIMPWNQSPWIQACNPVKLKEYLAVGRPIVSTPFPELSRYGGLVRVADNAQAFAEQVRRALDEPFDPEPGRSLVRSQTWSAKAQAVLEALAQAGLRCPAWPTTSTAPTPTTTTISPTTGSDAQDAKDARDAHDAQDAPAAGATGSPGVGGVGGVVR